MNLFNPWDNYGQFWRGAQEWSSPGAYTVAGHGNQVHMVGPDGKPISVKELAKKIKKDKNWRGRDIVLGSCLTGDDYKGNPSFAQNLADALGVTVMAPTDLVWYNYEGMKGAGPSTPPRGTMGPWVIKMPGGK